MSAGATIAIKLDCRDAVAKLRRVKRQLLAIERAQVNVADGNGAPVREQG